MANDFMKNANKMSLNGEVVSFSDTLPKVEVKEVVTETPIVEEPKKTRKAKKEEKVEKVDNEKVVDETNAETAESTEEKIDEEKVEE